MKVNKNKWKVLHLAKKPITTEMDSYKVGDTWFSNATCEKALGIVVDQEMNMSQQCDVVAEKANA